MRPTLIVLAIVLTSSIAAAQAPGQTPSVAPSGPGTLTWSEPAPTTVSYRSQILTSDVASLGLVLVGPLVTRNAELSILGVGGYFLGAPLVHLAQGRGGAAATSLALRAGLPLAGALAGYHLGPNDVQCAQSDSVGSLDGGCPRASIAGMLVGFAAGGVAAIAIDSIYLAQYQTRRPSMWTASVQPSRGGMSLSIGGAF